MIVTPASIAFGFCALLGVVLAGVLLCVLRRALAPGRSPRDVEQALVPGLVLGQALLAVRLVSWPLLYAMLVSYVPLTPRAMCVYGVTQKVSWLVRPLELLEPATLVVAGSVLILLGAYRSGSRSVAARTIALHLLLGAFLSLSTSVAGLAYLMVPKGSQEVSCCGGVFTSPDRFTASAAGLFLGSAASRLILPAALWLAGILLLCQLLAVAGRARTVAVLGAALASLLHAGAAILALFEVVAPVLLDRPRHHCAYCLLDPEMVPGWFTPLALVAFGLATAIPIWKAWFHRVAGAGEDGVDPRWSWASIACLVLFWLLILVPYATHAPPR